MSHASQKLLIKAFTVRRFPTIDLQENKASKLKKFEHKFIYKNL